MWLTGLVAPRHVGSSQTRARTRVPCIGRQILNHCAIREALIVCTLYIFFPYVDCCITLFTARFLNLCSIDILGQIILGCEDCCVHCRMCSSIPDLYPLDASSTTPVMMIQNVSRHCPLSPGSKIAPG